MNALPLAKYRMKTYHNHDGAYFPETIYFWGTHRNEDYGWHRKNEKGKKNEIMCKYIQYEWQGGIELSAMMLEYYHHTQDAEFLTNTLLPFAKDITMFYDKHYSRDAKGKLVIFPGNALEDVWGCTNPAPEVAGLRYILPQLITLTPRKSERDMYTRFLSEIPELPKATSDTGKTYLLPSAPGTRRRGNCEKPECYALFPYRLYGVGLPNLDIAKETFRLSPKSMKGKLRNNGWPQDSIFIACTGDADGADGAAKDLARRSRTFDKTSRFPAFWGPNFDWTPDQCHGGVNMITLQQMLIQTDASSNKIHLLPAWPKDWDVDFKLHVPQKTIVTGTVKDGKLVLWNVQPASRKKDVIVYDCQPTSEETK